MFFNFLLHNYCKTRTESSAFDVIPIEIIHEITKHIQDSNDWFSLLLTNKLFNSIAMINYVQKDQQKTRAIKVRNNDIRYWYT